MLKIYGKLVRDQVLHYIRKDGEIPRFRKLTFPEYKEALRHKLIEEATEVAEAQTPEDLRKELADLLEVFYALVRVYDIKLRDLEKIREQRRYLRGGFAARILLLYTEAREVRKRR